MKRFSTLMNRTKSSNSVNLANAPPGSPEVTIIESIRQFCESSNDPNGSDETHVLHLPAIVEAAESSPAAATAATLRIRKYLTREWAKKPHVQYHAVMLVRILSDNPGPLFTRNFDKTFVGTVKEILRNSSDRSTQQILRETLDALEVNKADYEGVQPLIMMWKKEKGQQASLSGGRRGAPQTENATYQPGPVYSDMSYAGSRQRNQLPPPGELASRVEESRNTAKILLQLIQSTPSDEIMNNELFREFGERCQSAQKSMQQYINCENPAPDHDTLQTLIETNEQLSLASSRYQRAILGARRAHGRALGETTTPSNPVSNGTSAFASPAVSPPPQEGNMNGSAFQPPNGPPPTSLSSFAPRSTAPQLPALNHTKAAPDGADEPVNPFADPEDHDTDHTPLAMEPTNYGNSSATPTHPSQPSQTFNINSEPIYAGSRRNTKDLESDYNNAATHTSNLPAEIDSHSNVGRRNRDDETVNASRPNGLGPQSAFAISSVDTATSTHAPNVGTTA